MILLAYILGRVKKYLDKFWHKTVGVPYRLPVDEYGNGQPLILLHGLGANRQKWNPLVNILDKTKWRIIAPDLFGFGDSPKPEWSEYDVQIHAKMVTATLKRKKLRKNLTIVGHSMGCLVAVHIAATNPDLVKRLVLYQPPMFADAPDFKKHLKSRQRYFAFFEYISSKPSFAYIQSKILSRISQAILDMQQSVEAWEAFTKSLKNTIMGQTAYDELLKLQVPTDIIYGRLDFVITRAEIDALYARNPHITLHRVTETHDVTNRSAKYISKVLNFNHKPKSRRKSSAVKPNKLTGK